MFKIDQKRARSAAGLGQAATELAVFGAILIFVLGTIVNTAVGNSYAQNQNFKAMRMAMMASWEGSKLATTSHNSAAILFIEDRLSPDFNKYGALDRIPFVANGSGTFSFELMYPIDPSEVESMLPIMDVYINGQHFPFTTASYLTSTITRTTPEYCSQTFPANGCAYNQCMRNYREWVSDGNSGATVNENQFTSIVPLNVAPTDCQTSAGKQVGNVPCCSPGGAGAVNNACLIFTELVNDGEIKNGTVNWSVSPPTGTVGTATVSPQFTSWYQTEFPGTDQAAQLSLINGVLSNNKVQYKLFYSQAVNGTTQYTTSAPTCASHPCKDQELSTDLITPNSQNVMGAWNTNGDMMFDLQRLGTYDSTNPSFVTVASGLRPSMAWQWSATAAIVGGGDTTDGADPIIGLDPDNNQWPQYDIDGRLQAVTIYAMSQDPSSGFPTVTYEDFQKGDFDQTWDPVISCGPKPGLQNDAQILTFTKNAQNGTNGGTYLQIKDGGLYTPGTDQFVRSANKRDTIDLIQRLVQLSYNTGRFCPTTIPPGCPTTSPPGCYGSLGAPVSQGGTNPVEICVDSTISGNNCFTPANVGQTCMDINGNMLYVRSRLEDRRGTFWNTDTAGQIQVK
jgi:hypothetical protein